MTTMRRPRIQSLQAILMLLAMTAVHTFSFSFQTSHLSQLRTRPTTLRHERVVSWNSLMLFPQPQATQHRLASAQSHEPPSPRRDSLRTIQRIFLCSALIGAMVLFPRAAMASTLSPEAVASTAAVPTAAAVAAAPSVLAPSIASPISAAMELRLTVRLLYAALMGAALGKERSFAKHSAGVRTMSLVALGASAFTICSIFGFSGRCDTARIAANVASGVGFIGAGVITTSTRNSKNLVHGLTTAATIWNAAAVGMACGVGLLRIATTSALVTLGILRLGRRKPKHQAQSKQDQPTQKEAWLSSQQSRHPLIPAPRSESQHVHEEEDDDEDQHAEVHDTSDWDEHADEEDEEENNIPQQPAKIRTESDQPDDSSLMQDVVRSAWRNSTDYLDTLVQMEASERQRSSKPRSSSDYRP